MKLYRNYSLKDSDESGNVDFYLYYDYIFYILNFFALDLYNYILEHRVSPVMFVNLLVSRFVTIDCAVIYNVILDILNSIVPKITSHF